MSLARGRGRNFMSLEEIMLCVAIATLIVCPPKFDPAIRLKEWLLRRSR